MRLTSTILAILALALTVGLVMGRDWIKAQIPAGPRDFLLGSVLGFRVERDVMVPMRDGVRLATNLYIPTKGAQPLPTVLIRLPYNKDTYGEVLSWVVLLVRRGYVVAAQDMRGRFRSEGVFTPYLGDPQDGSDTVDWLARQPWSNGRVGTVGCSALGETQVLLARERNPNHAALIAIGAGGAIGSAGGRYEYFGLFEGGIFNLASGFGWFLHHGGKTAGAKLDKTVDVAKAVRSLPTIGLVEKFRSDPTDFDDFLSRPLNSTFWKELGYIGDEDRFSTPALIVNSWQDQTVASSLALADLMKRNQDGTSSESNIRVIIGPGNHCGLQEAAEKKIVGDLPLGDKAAQPYKEWYVTWLDYWLRDDVDRAPDFPPYRFYILGEDCWAQSQQWPPRGVVFKRWYLDGTRAANSSRGGGTLSPKPPKSSDRSDEFRYDPNDPVPTRGGPICCTGNPTDRSGPVDQAEVESRNDVLVYTSAPLSDGLRIAGPLSAELYISSSAPDTDLVVKLVDVRPDGTALNIQEGALRMRYRDGFVEPKLMKPDDVYLARVDMRAIAYYLPPGHALRLQVTSSNFPRLERNLNTGGRNFDETIGVVSLNRVYTTPDQASAVLIPEWPDIRSGLSQR